MIAVVKDVLIYVTVIAAIIVVPLHLGGYGKVFSPIPAAKLLLAPPPAGSLGSFSAYATLALGSALALFLYPHSITGVLSSSSARVVRRNAAVLPAYSLLLGLLALVGFMAIAVGVQSMPEFADGFKRYGNNFSVPALFLAMFPSWFVGVAFAAIAIGALVPAAIMSIATANTFTRNIYREFIHPALHGRRRKAGWRRSCRWSSRSARWCSSSSCRCSTRSSCNCSAACGSSRRCRRSSSACTRGC